jgi:dolichol-phosphate mannosyltransferase
MPKISVILPTYNEKGNIEKLIEKIFSNLPQDIETIVIDDDSPDGTWKVVENISKRDSRVRLVRRINQRGLTSAIARGISLSKGQIVVWMDGDFSMPPPVLPQLTGEIGPFDIVVGSRYVKGGKDMRSSRFRVLMSKVFDTLAQLFLQVPVRDLTTGFVAAKKEVFNTLSLSGDYGDYCIDFLYRAVKQGFKVKEIPYVCLPRSTGKTKTNPHVFKLIRHGCIYIWTVLKLRLSGPSLSAPRRG